MNRDSRLIFEAYIANLKENNADISKYKSIIDKLSKGEFDTESQKELVDKGVKEGIFDVEVVDGKRQVVLTNEAIKQIEEQYPELKDKFWECGKCKADYPGCGEAKREKSDEDAEMPYPEFVKLSKHAASKLPEDESKKKLKYTYEIATAFLPRDINTNTKEGQERVLELAFDEVVKRVFKHDKTPKKRAMNLFMYDEDFPMEVVSQYNWYQEHGFPDVKDEFRDQMPDSREEYSAQDYAHEMEVKGEQEETTNTKRQKNNESRWMSTLSKFFRKEYRREGTDPYLEFFEVYSPHYEDWVIKKFSDIYNQNQASDPESKIDVEHFIKVKNELKNKKDAENIKLQSNSEEEERRLDPKCWKGYHKQGTKMKGGKRVNNCVKNK